jgi:hypothetical protein
VHIILAQPSAHTYITYTTNVCVIVRIIFLIVLVWKINFATIIFGENLMISKLKSTKREG